MSDHQVCWDVAVGIDWADSKHDYALPDGTAGEFANSPEEIHRFVFMLKQKFPNKVVAICLEQSHGSLIYALLEFPELVLFPINPAQLASYRKAMNPSGKIDDLTDAELLCKLLQLHGQQLRSWRPDTSDARTVHALVEQRRMFVNERTRFNLKLQACLKKYYPLVLELSLDPTSEMALALISKWPTLAKLKRQKPEYLGKFFRTHNCRSQEKIEERIQRIRNAQPLVEDSAVVTSQSLLAKSLVQQIRQLNKTIADYDHLIAKHAGNLEETALFNQIRGVGQQLAPRLAVAFGTDRERFQNAAEIQAYTGIAPVTRKSGKKKHVGRRYACPKFLKQTFHEFAEQMRKYSDWSRAFYKMMRAKGKSHHVAVRALAFKWIRILFVVWKNQTPYCEERYLRQLKKRKSPIIDYYPQNLPNRA
jgi:transposase